MRISELNVSLALQFPHAMVFSKRLPPTVRMSPKYVELLVPQLGHGPCISASAS